jgi:tetratricopeptide (TPR) repeat protein
MKTCFLLAVVVWVPLAANALLQDEKELSPDQKLFEEAMELYQHQLPERSLYAFREFMLLYPSSPLAARAHYNVALILRQLNDTTRAIATFIEILDKDEYNERDSNDLMEPYTLYKHHSCRNLAEMSLEKKQYAQAARYIEMFDKKFPYQHFCGNEWAAYDMYRDVMVARVLEGQHDIKKAIRILITSIPENGLASNQAVLKTLDGILSRNYSFEQLQAEFTQALNNFRIETKKKETYAVVTLFGEPVRFEQYYTEQKNPDTRKAFREAILANELFLKYATR